MCIFYLILLPNLVKYRQFHDFYDPLTLLDLNPYLEGAKHLVRLIAFSLKNSETEILERKHYATDMHRLLRGSRTFDQNDGCKMCRGSLVCNLSFIQIWLFIGMNVRKKIQF